MSRRLSRGKQISTGSALQIQGSQLEPSACCTLGCASHRICSGCNCQAKFEPWCKPMRLQTISRSKLASGCPAPVLFLLASSSVPHFDCGCVAVLFLLLPTFFDFLFPLRNNTT